MTVLLVLLVWLVLLPVAGIICARVLGYGERPSTPRATWSEDVAVAPRAASSPARDLTRTS